MLERIAMNPCTCKPDLSCWFAGCERHASSWGLKGSEMTSCSVTGQRGVSWPIPEPHHPRTLSITALRSRWRVCLTARRLWVQSLCVSLSQQFWPHSGGCFFCQERWRKQELKMKKAHINTSLFSFSVPSFCKKSGFNQNV